MSTEILKRTSIVLWVFLGAHGWATQETVLRFAPLPTKSITKNVEEFLPMKQYLELKLGDRLVFVYKKDYRDILTGFKDKEIDIAYLGPLPFVMLLKEYADIEPLVTFKQKDGSTGYRCVLAKFQSDTLDTTHPIKVALTQPLSTCGYLMTHRLLQQKYGLDLAKQQYRYTMSHTNALSSVAQGRFVLAGAKESIAMRFESLGLEIVAHTELLPGFLLVANKKTLTASHIQSIKNTLLHVPKSVYLNWNRSLGNQGMLPASYADYDKLDTNITIPTHSNMP